MRGLVVGAKTGRLISYRLVDERLDTLRHGTGKGATLMTDDRDREHDEARTPTTITRPGESSLVGAWPRPRRCTA